MYIFTHTHTHRHTQIVHPYMTQAVVLQPPMLFKKLYVQIKNFYIKLPIYFSYNLKATQ